MQLLWRDITIEKNQELYSSLPSRMAAIIKCKSTIIKYYFKEDIFIFLSMQLSSYLDLILLMIILLEKVAPVPLFTDNFQRIFTIRRYHPRCENLT